MCILHWRLPIGANLPRSWKFDEWSNNENLGCFDSAYCYGRITVILRYWHLNSKRNVRANDKCIYKGVA